MGIILNSAKKAGKKIFSKVKENKGSIVSKGLRVAGKAIAKKGALAAAGTALGVAGLAVGAAVVGKKAYNAFKNRKKDGTRRRKRAIPRTVSRWLTKKERELEKLMQSAKIMRKMSNLNFKRASKSRSEGVITAQEARTALRK